MTYPCDPMCPFLGCASCAYSGGAIPAAATESAPVSGVATDRLRGYETAPGVALTNTEGLTTQTGLES